MLPLQDRVLTAAYRVTQSSIGKKPLSKNLAGPLAELIASHWENTGAISERKGGTVQITNDARSVAKRIAQRVEWMTNPERHHGQQAEEVAKKTLRAIRMRRITFSMLADQCKAFGAYRRKGVQRKAKTYAHAKPGRFHWLHITESHGASPPSPNLST